MSTTSAVVLDDGVVEVMDWSFSPDEVTPAFADYLTAKDAADADFDQGRLDSHERWTGPALTAASDRLREACALRFESLDDFERHIIRETKALRNARRAQAVREDEGGVVSVQHVTDLEVIEGVDLDAVIKCSSPECNNRADYLVGRWCGFCGWTQEPHHEPKTQAICGPHWHTQVLMSGTSAECVCGEIVTRRETFHVVEVLR